MVYGAGLRCVALYGSAARGEQITRRSDLNVLVLVDSVDMAHLKRESAVARSWSDAGNPPPLTLTVDEWTGSADIYPMEYADILSYHRVLHGTLPRDGVQVRHAELRLQLEHEAQSKVLRLRHAILSAGAAPKAMAELLADSASTMLVLLRAALRLAGEDPPADSFAMLDRVQARTGLNVEVFRRVVRHRRGEAKLAGDDAVRAAEEYLAGATALARWVDQQGVE
jgi:hypothetical protein